MASIRGAATLYNSSFQFAQLLASNNPALGVNPAAGAWPIGSGSSSPNVTWFGGRTALLVSCPGSPGFPPTSANLQVQFLMPDNQTWIQVGSGALAQSIFTPQAYVFDAPPGLYRVFSNSGVIAGLFVSLTGIDYGQ